MARMLEGVKVLDFTINAAGPIVGSYFADYGAEVVKIEPPGGEAGRRFAYYVGGMSTYACGKDRGKKSIEMNLKDPEAVKLILSILPEYDIVLQSFKPGVMEKMGLGYEAMKAVKPDIIYCSMTAFGSQPSKYMNKPAYDICAVAMSGLNDQTGFPDGPPVRIGSVIGDMCGAQAMFPAALMALYHHDVTGEGQYIDVSLLRNMIHLNGSLECLNKKGHQQVRNGNHNSNQSPYGIYTGKTMSMVIAAVSPSTWNPLCDVMGREDLKTDARTKDLPSRTANHKFVEDTVTEWLMSFEDSKVAYDLLEKAGVPCSPVMTAAEVWNDEEYKRLGWWVDYPMYSPEWDNGGVATNRHCPYFADFSSIQSEADRPLVMAPRVGENNMEILTSWGKSEEEAKALLTKWGAKV